MFGCVNKADSIIRAIEIPKIVLGVSCMRGSAREERRRASRVAVMLSTHGHQDCVLYT